MLQKLMSGGQTGVDQAALNVGLALGLAVDGWYPKGVADRGRARAGYCLDHILRDKLRAKDSGPSVRP